MIRRSNTYGIAGADWDRAIEGDDELPETVRSAVREERLFALKVRAAERAVLADPSTRACETCRHFERQPCCEVGSDDCGCKGLNDCAVGAHLRWKSNGVSGTAWNPDGWWSTTIDHRVYCPAWETP
jgi:hypothetical protein